MTQLDALTRKFTPDEIQRFEGRGGRTMSYVEDEAVMDRLDEAFGIGGWSVHVEPIPVYEGVVKVRLEAGGAIYEDFGYPNRQGGESLKEAVSDGIRRCGRYLGIARDLYRRDAPVPVSSPANGTAAAGRTSPRPVAAAASDEPEYLRESFQHGNGAAVAGSSERMTLRELMGAAEAQGIDIKILGAAARKTYGDGMLKNLDDEQRAVVWSEVAR